MKRFTLLYIICAALCSSFVSCTNDGDIGDLYGRWQIEQLESVNSEYPSNLYLSFQSYTVFASINNYENHTSFDFVGNWRREGDSLFMSFLPPREDLEKRYKNDLSERFWFLNYHDVRVEIISLDNNSMTLQGPYCRWHLRSF